MAENMLTGGVASPAYPTFQPMAQPNPLAQVNELTQTMRGIQGLQQQQFELGKARTMFVQDRLGSLLTKPDLSIKDAQDMVADMVRNNVIPASEAPQILVHFPQEPEKLRAAVKQSYLSTLDHTNRMNLGFGQPVSVNTGGATQFGSADPMRPGQPLFVGGTTLPNTMSPGLTEGPPVRDAAGGVVPTRITNEQAEGLAKGRYKMGPNGQIIPVGTTPVGQAIAGAPAGAMEAASKTGGISAEMAGDLTRSASAYPVRQGMLENLQNDLDKFTTGPYAGWTLAAKRAVNDVSERTGGVMPEWDKAGVAAHENFNKQAVQLAQMQFAGLGGTGTDQQLGSAFKANPNDALSKMGNRQIIALLQGNEDALAAKNTAWQQWKEKNGADSYDRFQADFNKDFSPRAFQFVRMNPAERKEMLTKMSPAERSQVAKALDQAEKRGWVKPD